MISGTGGAFSCGGDLSAMMLNGSGGAGASLRELTIDLHAAIVAFSRLRAPVIAAVNGTAAGAGVGLAAMADLAVAAEGAKFVLAYSGIGLAPDGGTWYFLPRTVGHTRSAELTLCNRTLTTAEALQWGRVNKVVPHGDVLVEAGRTADRPAAGPPSARAHAKRLMRRAAWLGVQLEDESRTIARQGATTEAGEGIAAFLGKRTPDFQR